MKQKTLFEKAERLKGCPLSTGDILVFEDYEIKIVKKMIEERSI